MRMESIFPNIEPSDFWKLMTSEEDRIKWDKRYINAKVLGHNDAEGSTILHACSNRPPGGGLVIAQRDFVIEAFRCKDGLGEGRNIAIGCTVEHAEAPPANGWFDYVRATVHLQAGLVEKNPNGPGTRLLELRHTNPNGGMMEAVIN